MPDPSIKRIIKNPNRKTPNVRQAQRPEEKDWHWTLTVMIIGLLFGIFSLATAGGKTMVSFAYLSRFVAFCCLVWLLIPLKYYCRWLGINKLLAFLFSVMGAGPIICGLLLWTNYLVRMETVVESHPIKSQSIEGQGYFVSMLFVLEDNAFDEYEEFRRFEIDPQALSGELPDKVKFTMAKGLLGYRVMVDRELVY